MRHNPDDERDDDGATIARPVVDEAAERHKVRKDSGGSRGEGSAASLNPKTLPRVSGNHDRSAPRDRDRTHQPLSGPHRVLRNALQRGERESRTRLDGPRNAPCGDGTPEGGAQIKGHGQSVSWSRAGPSAHVPVCREPGRPVPEGWQVRVELGTRARRGAQREGQSGERTEISTVRRPEETSHSVSRPTGPGSRIPRS
jgi:hypothetical protein